MAERATSPTSKQAKALSLSRTVGACRIHQIFLWKGTQMSTKKLLAALGSLLLTALAISFIFTFQTSLISLLKFLSSVGF
jgi:hypothetical protein